MYYHYTMDPCTQDSRNKSGGKVALLVLILIAGSLALPHLAHAAIPFFDPIIPDDINKCAAGWGALIIVINRLIQFLITLAIVFVAPLMIAYSGFLFVVNPVSSGGKEKARSILTNTVVGIVIALAGWMIVDAIMVVLYNPGASSGTTTLQAWSSIVYGDSSKLCLIQEAALKDLNQSVNVQGISASGVITTSSGLRFTSEASAQVPTASAAVTSLLSCMGAQLKAGATVTSISDNVITRGVHTIEYCAANGCSHTANSCHYGGRNCVGASYAVDISGNSSDIAAAAQACNASYLIESSHVHVSVGQQNGCGCDARLD